MAEDAGWNCADCGKLPCECPNIIRNASIALIANVHDRRVIVEIRDNETGNKMAVELSLESGALLLEELGRMLKVLGIMRIVMDN